MATHAESAIKKAVDGQNDRTSTRTGNYAVDMVYEKGDYLELQLYYHDPNTNRKQHLAKYKMDHYPKKGRLKTYTDRYPEPLSAFKKALKALNYPISK